jgi:8-amino-7-oxononanoate synthase
MSRNLDSFLQKELAELDQRHLRRTLRPITSAQGPTLTLEDREVINFASNDYLGLAAEPQIVEAAREAAARFGAGSGASRLISGTLSPHTLLEEKLAAAKSTAAALSFACGYSTALGTIPALVGPGDVVILDKLSHACLVDAARLSGATLRVFPHNNTERLEAILRQVRTRQADAKVLLVTESVFSMDGDLAPLREIVALKEKYGAWLLVDEAHGFGVLGPQGAGLIAELGLSAHVEIQMGTLGKALGSAGGFIAGSATLIDFLINKARSFIFSTAPPPAQAAAATAALDWLSTTEGQQRIHHLRTLREAWPQLHPPAAAAGIPASAILPLPVGGEEAALQLGRILLEAGFWVPAVRYPTVPRGQARLRLSLTARHEIDQLRALAQNLQMHA